MPAGALRLDSAARNANGPTPGGVEPSRARLAGPAACAPIARVPRSDPRDLPLPHDRQACLHRLASRAAADEVHAARHRPARIIAAVPLQDVEARRPGADEEIADVPAGEVVDPDRDQLARYRVELVGDGGL